MSEKSFYNEEFSRGPEQFSAPEHTFLPEYNAVRPDASFFKESAVTAKEENISQGEVPEGEPSAFDAKEERREKRRRYNLLKKLLGSAVRGGAAALAVVAVAAAVSSGEDPKLGHTAASIKEILTPAHNSAFTPQEGYSPKDFGLLWSGDPEGPHKYDYEHALVLKDPSCTEEGEGEYVCLECGLVVHGALAATGHKASEPAREKEKAATCTEEGYYEEVVKCSVCGEELSRKPITLAAAGHKPAPAEFENETPATCTEDGVRTEIVKCSVCGEELSRETVVTAATGHIAADPVYYNVVDATCTRDGSHDEAVYCSVCGEELSYRTVTAAATGHRASTPSETVISQASCTEAGSKEVVTYCAVCGEELSRQTQTIAATGHKSGAAVIENATGAVCTQGGSYDEVSYCSVCGEEISRRHVTTAATGHKAGQPQIVHETQPTCSEPGFREIETVCTVCGEVIDVRSEEIPATGIHTAGDPELISETPATCTEDGSYEKAVRCTVCGEIISRDSGVLPATGHSAGAPQKEYIDGQRTQYQMVTYCSVCGEEISRGEVQTETVHVHDFGLIDSTGSFVPPAEGAYLNCAEDKTAALYLSYNNGNSPSMTLSMNGDFLDQIAKAGFSIHSVIIAPAQGEGPQYFTEDAGTITVPISEFTDWSQSGLTVQSGMVYQADVWFGGPNTTEYHIVSNTITVP